MAAAQPAPSDSSSFDSAVDGFGESIKWIAVSAGAIGGVLVAGLSLKDPAALTGEDLDSATLWIVAAFAGIALILVIAALASSIKRSAGLSDALKKKKVREAATAVERTYLGVKGGDWTGVEAKKIELNEALGKATNGWEADPKDSAAEIAFKKAEAAMDNYNATADQLIQFFLLRHRKVWTVAAAFVIGVLLVGVGYAVFQYSIKVYAPTAAQVERLPAVMAAPLNVSLDLSQLTESERSDFTAVSLDDSCFAGPLESVLLERSVKDGEAVVDILILPTPDCRPGEILHDIAETKVLVVIAAAKPQAEATAVATN